MLTMIRMFSRFMLPADSSLGGFKTMLESAMNRFPSLPIGGAGFKLDFGPMLGLCMLQIVQQYFDSWISDNLPTQVAEGSKDREGSIPRDRKDPYQQTAEFTDVPSYEYVFGSNHEQVETEEFHNGGAEFGYSSVWTEANTEEGEEEEEEEGGHISDLD